MHGMSNKTKIFLQVLAVFGLAIAINFVSYLNKNTTIFVVNYPAPKGRSL
jgi:hypothetical protein